MADEAAKEPKKDQGYWLIYLGILIGGLMMLAQAASYHPAQKISARLGVALLYSAFALFVGNGRPAGYIATAIIWAVTITLFLI